jgi:L-rhamnose mutarotase
MSAPTEGPDMSDGDDTDVERVAMIQYLDSDRVDDYLEAHEDVPDAVADAMDRGGVYTYELFVHDDVSVGYAEIEDFDAFVEEYTADEECQEWERRVAEFKRSGVDVDESEVPLMDHVWSLDDDGRD